MYDGIVQELIDELGRLPGIGPKSAQRIAYYLLEADAEEARRLANAILAAAAFFGVLWLVGGSIRLGAVTVPGQSATDRVGAVAASTPDDAALHRLMAFVPYLLLGLSFLGAAAIGGEDAAERLPWLIPTTTPAWSTTPFRAMTTPFAPCSCTRAPSLTPCSKAVPLHRLLSLPKATNSSKPTRMATRS